VGFLEEIMKQAKYKNPRNNVVKNPAIACVMPIFVPEGQIENYDVRSNVNPNKYYEFTENKLESIKFTLACYKHYKTQLDYDLILVNNDSRDKETLQFLKKFPKVYHRENRGFSFGAYQYIWDKFGNQYEYYLFHEQDWGPAKDYWLEEILTRFLSDREIGAVGNTIEDRPTDPIGNVESLKEILGTQRERLYNLDGAYTFTSSRVLRQSGIEVLECEPHTSLNAMYNEILFQQPILEQGYKLSSFDDNKHIRVAGISIYDIHPKYNKLTNFAPIIQGNARFFSRRIANHFNWYDKRKRY